MARISSSLPSLQYCHLATKICQQFPRYMPQIYFEARFLDRPQIAWRQFIKRGIRYRSSIQWNLKRMQALRVSICCQSSQSTWLNLKEKTYWNIQQRKPQISSFSFPLAVERSQSPLKEVKCTLKVQTLFKSHVLLTDRERQSWVYSSWLERHLHWNAAAG